jgi:glycosyltransferase involved in cell wall biosynthesis
MRIAILHYTQPPVIGGVERVIGEQASALAAMDHEVSVFDRSADARVRFHDWLPRVSKADEGVRAPPPFVRVRQWIEQDDHHPYFEPAKEITRHRHVLPHWQQAGKLVFVTWRLADSLPQEKLTELREQKRLWELKHPKPWSATEEFAFHDQFDEQIERWLNAGMGSCVLKEPEVRQGLIDTLHHADGKDYDMLSYVVMPNHVHLLFRLRAGAELEKVIQAWKSISSRRIGQKTGQKGEWWQEGYRDRLIRGPEHLENVLNYIRRNAPEAKLKEGMFAWWECGRPRPPSLQADEGVRAPLQSIVIVHNVFTMPFDLAWTDELIKLTETRPDVRWINWVHDVRWAEKVPQAVHVAVSAHRRLEYAKHTGEPIHVIPNGCDAKAVLGLEDRIAALKLEKAGLVLLQPTRFVRRKNIEMGLRVLAELPNAIYLVTAAPDPHQKDGVKYFRELKRLAKELGVTKRVRFLGEKAVLSDEEVRSLYEMADALFFPSFQEGYGLPLIEAALHQVPVFCSDIPAHREVAPAEAVLFKLAASPKGLARKIRAHAGVKARQARRALMARLDWETLLREKLLPLLGEMRLRSGRRHSKTAS